MTSSPSRARKSKADADGKPRRVTEGVQGSKFNSPTKEDGRLRRVTDGDKDKNNKSRNRSDDNISGRLSSDLDGWALEKAVTTWLRERDEEQMCKDFDDMEARFGLEALSSYKGKSHHKHALVHELTKKGRTKVLSHVVAKGLDINVRRESDGCTALHLAAWNENPSLAEHLEKLGADPTIRNNHGESVRDLQTMEKPEELVIKAKLQGTQSAEDVLRILEEESTRFQHGDFAQALFVFVARSGDPSSKRAQPILEGCKGAINAGDAAAIRVIAAAVSQKAVAAVLDCFAEMVTNGRIHGLGASVAADIAFCFAKANRRSPTVFHNLAQEAVNSLREAEAMQVAKICWSIGSAQRDREEDLLNAVAVELEWRMDEFSNQSLANIIWAFARLKSSHEVIRGVVADAVVERAKDFTCQDVSNTIWAYAALHILNVKVFHAMFRRAQEVSTEVYRQGKERTSREQIISLAQLFWGYELCRRHCADALEGLDPQFLEGFQRLSGRREELLSSLGLGEVGTQDSPAASPSLKPRDVSDSREQSVSPMKLDFSPPPAGPPPPQPRSSDVDSFELDETKSDLDVGAAERTTPSLQLPKGSLPPGLEFDAPPVVPAFSPTCPMPSMPAPEPAKPWLAPPSEAPPPVAQSKAPAFAPPQAPPSDPSVQQSRRVPTTAPPQAPPVPPGEAMLQPRPSPATAPPQGPPKRPPQGPLQEPPNWPPQVPPHPPLQAPSQPAPQDPRWQSSQNLADSPGQGPHHTPPQGPQEPLEAPSQRHPMMRPTGMDCSPERQQRLQEDFNSFSRQVELLHAWHPEEKQRMLQQSSQGRPFSPIHEPPTAPPHGSQQSPQRSASPLQGPPCMPQRFPPEISAQPPRRQVQPQDFSAWTTGDKQQAQQQMRNDAQLRDLYAQQQYSQVQDVLSSGQDLHSQEIQTLLRGLQQSYNQSAQRPPLGPPQAPPQGPPQGFPQGPPQSAHRVQFGGQLEQHTGLAQGPPQRQPKAPQHGMYQDADHGYDRHRHGAPMQPPPQQPPAFPPSYGNSYAPTMPNHHNGAASSSPEVPNGITPDYRQSQFSVNHLAGQWPSPALEVQNRGQSASYPGPPPDYDRAHLQAADDAIRAPSYSPERKQQGHSRFQFAQGALNEEEDFFVPASGFGSGHDPDLRGEPGVRNGYPAGFAMDSGMNGHSNGFPPQNYNSNMQPGNQQARQAHQQALMRANYEAERRMGNMGPNGHFNHQQDNYDMERHMSPQSTPGHSLSPTRPQKKGIGKSKNPANQYSQDFNNQGQNWQTQQMDMRYGGNPSQQARQKGQGGRRQGRGGKGSIEQARD